MGNTQILHGINPFDTSDNSLTSPEYSDTFDSDSESPIYTTTSQSSSYENKLVCEYCQEYFFPQFHQEHVRICSCNPVNLRVNNDPSIRRQGAASHSNAPSNPELAKVQCSYCNELCYLKYQTEHERVCLKNPENIKINCRYCSKTLNLILYQSHLECCEENYKDRRRSIEREPRSRNSRLSLANMRKVKTDTAIEIECCKGSKRSVMDKDSELDCPICLDTISSSFDMTVLTCNHKFHRRCLNSWSRRQLRCPICRKEFL